MDFQSTKSVLEASWSTTVLIRVDESDMACHNKVVLQEAFNDVLARGLQ